MTNVYSRSHCVYWFYGWMDGYFTKEYSLKYFTMNTVVLSSQRTNVAVSRAFLCSPDLPRAHAALTDIHLDWGIPNQ